MENYTALIVLVSIGIGLLDLFTDRWPVLQRQLFPIVTIVLYSLFAVLYYYGPDIWTYVPHYEHIGTVGYVWAHPEEYKTFEVGYNLFCSVLHQIGFSYWGMTVVIKTLYFTAIYLLIKQLPKHQLFVLGSIIMFDSNLIMHETRQCLAVSFFIFTILLLQHRHYLWAILCGVLTVAMHKSGFIPVGLLIIGVFLYQARQQAWIYTLFMVFLISMVILPVQSISTSILNLLPLPQSYIHSLTHHLLLGRQFQMISLIYLSILLILNVYVSYFKRSRYSWITYMVLAGMGLIAVLYPYYFLLARIRSYFIPFIFYYIFLLFGQSEQFKVVPYNAFIKQMFMILILAYSTHTAVSLERGARSLHIPVYRACTVFELRHAGQKQIRDRQMKTAEQYWIIDYMKEKNNRL